MSTASPYTPPATLSKPAQAHWKAIVTAYQISDVAGRLLLESALTSWDRLQQAQAAIKKGGLMVRDRYGGLKPNPLLQLERHAKAEMVRALSLLNLDLEPLQAPGRPPNR